MRSFQFAASAYLIWTAFCASGVKFNQPSKLVYRGCTSSGVRFSSTVLSSSSMNSDVKELLIFSYNYNFS